MIITWLQFSKKQLNLKLWFSAKFVSLFPDEIICDVCNIRWCDEVGATCRWNENEHENRIWHTCGQNTSTSHIHPNLLLLVSSLFLLLPLLSLVFRVRIQTMTIASLKGVVGCRLSNKLYATTPSPYVDIWSPFFLFSQLQQPNTPLLYQVKRCISTVKPSG